MVRESETKNYNMSLPNTNMEAVPFTPLTAEFLDDMNENIDSLSQGSGLENKAVGLSKINGGTTSGALVSNTSGVVSVSTTANYSTTEVNTGAKYIDNKAIYRITLTGTSTGAVNTDVTFTPSGMPTGIDRILFVEGYVSAGGSVMPVNSDIYTAGSLTVARYNSVFLTNGQCRIRSTTAWTSQPYEITYYYTKV